MKREDIRICIMRVGGTNCDEETKRSFDDLGVKADVIHLNRIVREKSLLNYDILVFPGGVSYGDYIRAGAIWGRQIVSELGRDLEAFAEEGRPVLGICNGFQVLVESGLLPAFNGISPYPEAVLASNTSLRYECRWIHLRHDNLGNCVFTRDIPKGKTLLMAVAHAEGRFLFSRTSQDENLKRLYDNDQIVFRYCDYEGNYANGEYPINPNNAFYDIAGICNLQGNVFGLMPHPERAFYGWQLPDWTARSQLSEYGDGRLIFKSVINYVCSQI